ncbi:MAG TPA: glycosyltransferase family 2 protein, partial [Capillimicrobium sp.]
MPDETVSIIIPTYERWDTIGATLRGALRQTGVDVEVVIVDDGATPAPDGLLDDPDGRVRHIHPPVRRGVGHARNVGVEAAEGSWVAFLDDDDLWASDKLERQLEACRSAGRDWGFSSGVYVDAKLKPFELLRAPSGDGLERALLSAQVIPGACSNVVARRDLVRQTEGFDPRLHQLADWDLWIRMAEAAPAASIDDVLVAYVQHAGSMLMTHRDPILREYALLTRKHRARADRLGTRMDPSFFGFWV